MTAVVVELGGRAASDLGAVNWAPHLATPWKPPHLPTAPGYLRGGRHSVSLPSSGGSTRCTHSGTFWDILPIPGRKIPGLPGLRKAGWWHSNGTRAEARPGGLPAPSQTPERTCLSRSPSCRPGPPGRCCVPPGRRPQRRHSHYLHPFFLMMFPRTTSALQKGPDVETSLWRSEASNPTPA